MSPPRTILLADDHRELREATAELLRRQGFHVLTAASGTEAVERYAAAGSIDLLITDLNMPGLDGLQLTDHLRDRQPQLPVLLASSAPSAELRQRHGRGEIAFLAKPFSAAQLSAALHQAEALRPQLVQLSQSKGVSPIND